jgi:hypothetical protein
MEKQSIYLKNLELALQMQRAGFDKECVHNIQDIGINLETGKREYAYTAYDKIISVFEGDYNFCLQLPTLGEIDLPEGICIKKSGKGYIATKLESLMETFTFLGIITKPNSKHAAMRGFWLNKTKLFKIYL